MLRDLDTKTNEINSIQIMPDRDYGWVWEYAKFRFGLSISDTNKVQDRASSLLKLVFYGFAAFWALFLYFFKERELPLATAFNHRIVFGLAGLCIAASLCIYCLLPVRKLLPYGEEVAIRFINQLPERSPEAQARFGLGLKLCSDFQECSASHKAKVILAAFISLAVSAALLFAGFYSWMLLAQSYGPRP